jgi:hypothetical protein
MPVIMFRLTGTHNNLGASRKLGVPPSVIGNIPFHGLYLRVFGVTKNKNTGAPIASCTVHLFRTSDDREMDETVSDGSGNYEFRTASLSTAYYVVAYDPTGLLAGVTLNTLIGS